MIKVRWLLFLLLAFTLSLSVKAAPVTMASQELACATVDVYVRDGCPHCDNAKRYLMQLQQRFPSLIVRYHNVIDDADALAQLEQIGQQLQLDRIGVPAFDVCGAYHLGFAQHIGTDRWLEAQITGDASLHSAHQINTPLGTFRLEDIGLPAFTMVMGLVDGVNPCAMWVLLFLLSILVNVRDRTRIMLIAGTFVLVSGLFYFAFMAAWLNVFLLLGFSRSLQIVLGLLAVAMGLVHLKDFIAFGRGVSLSIPASVKPTLYARIRAVLHAPSLAAALIGVACVAALVNVVELLCTAGLPALYTQILTRYPLSTGQYYGYLLLYNLAYILDDSVMVALAVITLNKRKLQEREGRWLKLVSGVVVMGLGIVLLAAPDALF